MSLRSTTFLMQKEDYIQLGYIGKAHGLNGEVKAVFDVPDILDYQYERALFLAKGDHPISLFQLEYMKIVSNSMAIVQFEGVNGREEAEAMKGHTIYFPKEFLPPLPEGEFYYYQVENFRVRDENLGELGTVRTFWVGSAQDVMVMDYQEKEVLIPVTDHIVLRADFQAEEVITCLPEGLLEIYL